jgi:hypothetical protein
VNNSVFFYKLSGTQRTTIASAHIPVEVKVAAPELVDLIMTLATQNH